MEGAKTPPILNLDIRWRRVVSLTFRLLYRGERAPTAFRIERSVVPGGGLDILEYGHMPLQGMRRPVRRLIAVLTAPSQLTYSPVGNTT